MTAERRTTALASTADHLGWFQIPRTLDNIIGIYAEATRETQRPMRHGLSNDEILAEMVKRNSGGGTGGHSDPTATVALWGEPDARDDADGTLGMIDADLARITEAASELDHTCSAILGLAPLGGNFTGRQARLNAALSMLTHLRPNLEPAIAAGADEHRIDELIHVKLHESAQGLRIKCQEIWQASRGDSRPVVVQRAIAECSNCSSHGITGTIAGALGLCANCRRFQSDEKCLPDQRICRAWDRGSKCIPNGWKLEAKAAAKVKPGRSRAS